MAVGDQGSVLLQGTTLPGDLRLGWHTHEPTILCLVLTGGFRETCERHEREVTPAKLVYYPPGVRHTGRFAASGSSLFSVDIPARLAASVFRDRPPPLEPLGPRLTGLMLRTWSELRMSDGLEPLLLESLVAEVLAEAGAALRSSAARRAWLPKVLEILHQRLRNPPTLSEIGREVEVHPCHLARTFRQTYRCSVGEYLRYLRVASAAAELEATSHSLVDIAYETGFADQSHFGRVFRRIVGVSPGKYRTLLH